MAPVGSRESLSAAINAGANSVYFGVAGLNMRSRSSANFTIDDLRSIAAHCKEHGVKTYLTVNTVIYNEDVARMHEVIDAAHEAGISAIIAADMAAIIYARSIGQTVHISTQLNVSNIEALKFYAQFADVVVLARELNLEQVKEIYTAIEEQNVCGPSGNRVRIEMFCHGALCMAVSGKCYMSLHQMNASANRGECNQICRRAYKLTDRETGDEIAVENQYLMSPKDLKTIHFLNRMADAGVRVFKIEGRARPAEYVDTTVHCYSEALDAVCNGQFTDEKIENWNNRLKTVFNRGFWDGYYMGQRLGEWSARYGSSATENKCYAGRAGKYYSKLGVGEFKVEASEIAVGDTLLVTGPTTGVLRFEIKEIRYNLNSVTRAEKGWLVSIPVPQKIRPSDKVYRIEERQ